MSPLQFTGEEWCNSQTVGKNMKAAARCKCVALTNRFLWYSTKEFNIIYAPSI